MMKLKRALTLIIFGIVTSGLVLSTLLHAADADYRLVVIKDWCADLDPDEHSYFPGHAVLAHLAATHFVFGSR